MTKIRDYWYRSKLGSVEDGLTLIPEEFDNLTEGLGGEMDELENLVEGKEHD